MRTSHRFQEILFGDSSLVGCYAMTLWLYFPTFRMNITLFFTTNLSVTPEGITPDLTFQKTASSGGLLYELKTLHILFLLYVDKHTCYDEMG
jgi:hypothetical protein